MNLFVWSQSYPEPSRTDKTRSDDPCFFQSFLLIIADDILQSQELQGLLQLQHGSLVSKGEPGPW